MSEPEESQDRDPRITVPASLRIDDLVESIPKITKTMFAGVLLDYVQLNFKNRGTVLLFERTRETAADREAKFRLVTTYNRLLDRTSSLGWQEAQWDLGIPCDLLLDLLRFESGPASILNPAVVCQDYRQQMSRGQTYEPSDFYIRIRNKCLAEIVKGVFKLVVLAYEEKAFRSLEAVCRNVADALSMET